MKRQEIPEKQKRLCIKCSAKDARYESNYTEQKPIAVEFHSGSRGCFGQSAGIEWKWECLECGGEQY